MTISHVSLMCLQTSVLRLRRLPKEDSASVHAKLECYNLSGSIEARPELSIEEDAERRAPDSIIS